MPTLAKYRKMRNFAETAEPRGGEASGSGTSYVIQKHAARRLHYDFRLELDGVLLSWAVPKGPSLDPKVKRLAVETEPHPLEYGGFEGTIPKGQYGGGAVMVWDRGSWAPEGDARKAYAKGHLHFTLKGEKLRGAWHLVRTGQRSAEGRNWLLFKAHDEFADETGAEPVLESPDSVLTGRSIEAIAAGEQPKKSRAAHGKRSRDAASASGERRPASALLELAGARRGKLPKSLKPQLASAAAQAPAGADWLHELEFEGERLIARIERGQVALLTVDGADWSERLPALASALSELSLERALLDGVLVALDQRGVSDPQALQRALERGRADALVYYVFDVLYVDGVNLQRVALLERKAALTELLAAGAPSKQVRLSAHVLGRGDEFAQAAARLGVRRVLSKRASAPYRAGRGKDWLTSECVEQDGAATAEEPAAKRAPRAKQAKRARTASHAASYPLTNPEKVMYPECGISKRELLDYYEMVQERMLPHVANRPLTIVRYPNGREKHGFFQKHPRPGTPAELRSISIRENEGKSPYSVLDDERGLFALVQLGALEIHTWGSRADDFEHADLLVFDLDPDPGLDIAAVISCAERLRVLFEQAKLESFVKTTGGKGLHVCIPIEPELDWDTVKDFTGRVAQALVREAPQKYVAMPTKALRRGKIFIDYLRNGRGATFIAPYSTRARENAPVAVPLEWDELTPKLKPDQYNVRNLAARLARVRRDPFERMAKLKQRLRGGQI